MTTNELVSKIAARTVELGNMSLKKLEGLAGQNGKRGDLISKVILQEFYDEETNNKLEE